MGRRTSGMSFFARIYSLCATDTGKQGELDLCWYLHSGIGLAAVHRCPQLLASLANSSAELCKICPLVKLGWPKKRRDDWSDDGTAGGWYATGHCPVV